MKTIQRCCIAALCLVAVPVFADISALVTDCDSCHGKNGVSTHSDIPTVAGYSAYYMEESLNIYKEKGRPCPEVAYPGGANKDKKTTMCDAVKALTGAQITEISEHYADLPFVAAKQEFDAALAKKGEALHELHCVKCHEDGGSSPDDDAGILAGQWMPFLMHQMAEYKAGKRPMDEKMKPKIDALSDEEIKALVNYYGSMQ